MAEDWRVTVDLRVEDDRGELLRALQDHQVEGAAGERIAVSGSGNHVFLYCDTERGARQAEPVVGQVLEAHGMKGSFRLDRWHPEEERWEDASVPLPVTAEARRVEHQRLEREETAESLATGFAAWEVRIELASHHDAHALAERLEQEGFQDVLRRWKFLLLGANDRDDADALAHRLKGELPPGATIHVEPGGGTAWELMPNNPFAVFGGLGG